MPANSLPSVHEFDDQPEKTDSARPGPSGISLFRRLRAHFGYKILLLFTVPAVIYVPYFALQRWTLFPVREMPANALEHLIPFQPDAVWAYHSIYFLALFVPACMTSKPELGRYTRAVLGTGLLANLCFLFWPTTCKRPVLQQSHAAYEFLVSVDAPLHACPSLHAGFAVLSALCLAPTLGRYWNWRWSAIVWLWVAVIFYATLATKQHVMTDLLAGSVLATIVYHFVYRRTGSSSSLSAVA